MKNLKKLCFNVTFVWSSFYVNTKLLFGDFEVLILVNLNVSSIDGACMQFLVLASKKFWTFSNEVQKRKEIMKVLIQPWWLGGRGLAS